MFPARSIKTRLFLINASGFTLGQLLASLTIITVCTVFVATVYSSLAHIASHESNRPSCASNIKQLGLGFLQYIQDYDEKFPPCAVSVKNDRVLRGWASAHDLNGEAAISKYLVGVGVTSTARADCDQLLSQYTRSTSIFHCPQATPGAATVSYMYNDLAAGVAQKDFAAPDKTVLVCDGEDFAGNVGHAYNPSSLPAPPYFFSDGAVAVGATLQTTPTRHNGGANYGFVDGHVKWSKPEAIYFSLRTSNSRSHIDKHSGDTLGPDPAKLSALGYIGTFHVK